MATKYAFSKREVLQVVALSGEGWSQADIASKFGRSVTSVNHILTGRSHRRITGIAPHIWSPECSCRSCSTTSIEEANLRAADAAECAVRCMACGKETSRRVVTVERYGGRVKCDSCDGRRK